MSDRERPVEWVADTPPKITPKAADVLVRLFRTALQGLDSQDQNDTEPAA